MNLTDSIADMLTRIRNAAAASLEEVVVPHSKLKSEVARILKQEGFVRDFEVEKEKDSAHKQIRITLKYSAKGPVIVGLKRISRPGLRVYVGSDDIPRVLSGMGVSVLSTSRGLMTGREAKQQKVGGELLCTVW
ncbi:MAG: 30S ribosomal protein S8 [Verrucomicrobia bacterium]|nr:30S ribosomal protein S8 [Verrucomicrobiota bacterium]